jgi:hypothetical protein
MLGNCQAVLQTPVHSSIPQSILTVPNTPADSTAAVLTPPTACCTNSTRTCSATKTVPCWENTMPQATVQPSSLHSNPHVDQ